MSSPLTHHSPITLPSSTAMPLHFPCHKLLEESSFTSLEKGQIKRFQQEVARRITSTGTDLSYLTMFAITQSCEIDTSMAAKDGLFMVALWVTLLVELSRVLPMDKLKYPTFDAFHDAYLGKFDHESIDEQHCLWHTANWMSILFQIIPAKKNKGLAMQVVPKLIEGWDAKYVTGSGQTKYTAYRVFLFESEGNTKASHRGRSRGSGNANSHHHGKGHAAKGKKRSSTGATATIGRPPKARRERSSSGDIDFHPAKRRKRRVTTKKSVSFSSSSSTMMRDNEVMEADGRIYVYNYMPSSEDHEDDEDHSGFSDNDEEANNSLDSLFDETDGDDQSVNAEVHTVFKSFKTLPPLPAGVKREETTSLSIPMAAELMRSDSLLNLKKPNLDRDVSWNEIPVSNQTSSAPAAATTTGMKRSASCNTILSAAPPSVIDFDTVFDNVWSGMYSHINSPMLVQSGLSSPHMVYGGLPGPSPVPFGSTTMNVANNNMISTGNAESTNQLANWWAAPLL